MTNHGRNTKKLLKNDPKTGCDGNIPYFCGNENMKNLLLMKTVRLITCNDAMQAHILQGALENEGIDSILHNENFSTLYKSCVSDVAGVDILVLEKDYEKAVCVLRDNQSWPEELRLCPYCGSEDLKFALKKGQRLRAVGAAILSMLATAPPGDNHWEYTCSRCGRTFEKPVARFGSEEENKHE